ncbi:MAG: hypothetical protein JWQ03_3097 [Variovorax sp.]|nr:hypothetical protein [Variovorax sp.]
MNKRRKKAVPVGELLEQIAVIEARGAPAETFDPETGEVFEHLPEAAAPSADTGDREPFGRWLLSQQKRDGWIGQLAKAAKSDPRFPKLADPEKIRGYLSNLGADGDMFEAIDDAELEWLAY